ncbi:hypothetical protein WS48_31075 [Burkholderia sp. RF7-non_BP1]|nr:hypothetical protein WS48_31075 [Burkholderia sp. RF7-non_BP1]KUY93399.1 hypothetical protein WS49_02760 [Burkholderia sp. RF7-non_BP4]
MEMGGALFKRVVNRPMLVSRFGRTFIEAINVELSERARKLHGGVARGRTARDEYRSIFGMALPDPDADRSTAGLSTESGLLRLSGRTTSHSQEARLADLNATRGGDDVAPAVEARGVKSSAGMETRADLAMVDTVLRAMKGDAISLVMSAVHAPDDDRKVLYFKCVPWCCAFEDGESSPDAYLSSIVRAGLTGCFDRYVVARVLDLLESSPQLSIGVNLSERSLVSGLQWESLLERLSCAPELAERLVVEVSEGARVAGGSARAFLDRLRVFGCRIAIDDYGLAYGVDVGMVIPEPDIVKIAPAFIAAARWSESARDRLRHLVRLGTSMARDVVVLGAQGAVDMALVCDVGAKWMQGD